MSSRRLAGWILMASLLAAVAYGRQKSVDVTIIGFNDFHGNLQSPGTFTINDPDDASKKIAVKAGGVEYLAAAIHAVQAKNPNDNVVVAAGDIIGASPLMSSVFHDEPSVDAMGLLGLEFSATGNHEYDKGRDELLRIQNGGCPTDGCRSASSYGGAKYKYLTANVLDMKTGKTLFPAYAIKSFEGIPVAFIGLALQGTTGLVIPTGVTDLEFQDEAAAANKLIPELKSHGVETIVILIHQGGSQNGGYDECRDMTGPIVGIADKLDKAVDVIISGHTHRAYNCTIAGKLVTSAASFGQMITEVDLKLDSETHDVVSKTAHNIVVRDEGNKDPAESALMARISPLVTPLQNRVVGSASTSLDKEKTAAGENVLGDIIADAQLAATRDPVLGGAQIALMNPGGVRTSIVPDRSGKVTYGDLFASQPFGNNLVVMSLTGNDIHDALEQQWSSQNDNKILLVSSGFTYTWDASKPDGQRVDPSDIKLNGVTLAPNKTYRVTVNSFLSTGGDNFTAFTRGTNVLGGEPDVDALETWFNLHSPVTPPVLNRIQRLH